MLIKFKTKEENPNVNGEVEAPIVLVDKIENHLDRIIDKSKKGLTLHAHSFVESYLKKGMPSIQQKWFFKYKKWIKVIPRDAYQYLEYHFFDKDGNEIK